MKWSKRVILLTPSMSKGGAETQLLKLALFLKSEGDQVLIISLKPVDEFKEVLEKSGLEVLFLKSWPAHFISNLRSLYGHVKKFKPQVMIAFMFIAIIFARFLKMRLKFKLISSIRISVLPGKWRMPFKWSNGLDDAVVYNSVASRTNFERRNPGLKKGIVIHNGIRIPVMPSDIVKKNDVFKWICVGHFRWNKDYPTLFKAIALIRGRNFSVDILGELAGATWPYQMIEELNIQQKVNLIGFQPEAAAYLRRSDAFVLSSFSEGMPNAVLEAMAYALPVVVTDIDGNNEILTAVKCGFLFEKQNEYELADRLSKIMDTVLAEQKALGQAGREYIAQQFSETGVMRQWKGLIENVLLEKR
ncbi:glycosyltransferase [Pedobacter caeni]|uniref:Glycosyltransferase involved in cell wall bisynthesis n=1 Tax=Pedobacter caeni TaxID=288992 RepID=A0A1M5GFV4_9SPHI|nr:glycosyltransferase [Pedobacter caeni]SHG02597.1 Glycosyltransferase involved in cell wall bisynthesis [Pedobacter caeni]